jgi:hypothetical protein
MKVYGLNTKQYKIDLNKYIVRKDDSKKRSSFHVKAREIIAEIFKGWTIYEEVKLPGTRELGKKSALFLDFFIPSAMIGVEVHGRQHYEFCEFFHKTKAGFRDHKRRDLLKVNWCELNSITLVELKYSDTEDIWRQQIEHAREA